MFTGKTFTDKRLGFSRFFLQNLLNNGKFNLFRFY